MLLARGDIGTKLLRETDTAFFAGAVPPAAGRAVREATDDAAGARDAPKAVPRGAT
jgi:hypothetical protein